MEEKVGLWWHRFITRLADDSHPEAAVELDEVARAIGMLYRAGGGQAGVRVVPVADSTHSGPRAWLQRIAGSGQRAAQSRLDAETLALPPQLDVPRSLRHRPMSRSSSLIVHRHVGRR